MAKETNTGKNGNLGTFVDVITPEPKIVTEDFIDFDQLTFIKNSVHVEQKKLIEKMVDMILDCDRQKKFLSLGEQFAFNSLLKLKIIV